MDHYFMDTYHLNIYSRPRAGEGLNNLARLFKSRGSRGVSESELEELGQLEVVKDYYSEGWIKKVGYGLPEERASFVPQGLPYKVNLLSEESYPELTTFDKSRLELN